MWRAVTDSDKHLDCLDGIRVQCQKVAAVSQHVSEVPNPLGGLSELLTGREAKAAPDLGVLLADRETIIEVGALQQSDLGVGALPLCEQIL